MYNFAGHINLSDIGLNQWHHVMGEWMGEWTKRTIKNNHIAADLDCYSIQLGSIKSPHCGYIKPNPGVSGTDAAYFATSFNIN